MSEGMYDPSDRIPLEVWDPTLGRNVFTGGDNSQYVQANAPNYQGYSGQIMSVSNQPDVGTVFIHPEAFGVGTGTRGGVPQSVQDYRNAYEQSALNPYQEPTTFNQMRYDFAKDMRAGPGVRPNFGFLPGQGGWNLETMLPATWQENQNWGGRRRAPTLTPEEDRILQTASDRRWQTPRVTELAQQYTGQDWPRFGRGWTYGGEPSPEEAKLTADLMAGRPTNYDRLFRLRQSRIQAIQPTGLQNFARQYYAPALATLATAGVGFAGGPVVGAAFGGLSQGIMTGWKNPVAIGLGAAGGALGGWGAGQGAQALGAGPVLTGAASGAGAGFGGQLGYQVGTGKFDPTKLATSTVVGGTTGGLSGATVQTNPTTGQPIPGSAIPPSVFAPPVNVAADYVNPPRRRRSRNPYQ